jgi:hypothetical protein
VIRFALYVLLLASSLVAGCFLLRRRGVRLVMFPTLVFTVLYSLFQVARVAAFWLTGGWPQEPPVSPALAAVVNGVALSWVLTAIVIVAGKVLVDE